MDHVIDNIKTYLDAELEYLREEVKSEKHKRFTDCPSYGTCKALVDAMHVLEKYYYGKHETLSVNDLVEA